MAIRFSSKSSYSDKELLLLLNGNKGDRNIAFSVLFQLKFQAVRKALAKQGGSDEDAQEVFQQVMLILVKKSRNGDLSHVKNIGAYVFKACKTQWLNLRRRTGRETSLSTQIIDRQVERKNDPYALLENKDAKRVVADMLGQLGKNCKYLLYWSLGEGIDMKRVAKDLNYENAQTAINLKARCKKRLKKLVNENRSFQELVNQIIFSD